MRLVVSSAAPTDLPASAAFSFSSFNIGAMPFRILCRLAVPSRYSCNAFFSPDFAVLWISSRTFFTTLSPFAGILSTRRNSRATFDSESPFPISSTISRSRLATETETALHQRAVMRNAPATTRPRARNARCTGARAAQQKSWLSSQSASNEAAGRAGQRYRLSMSNSWVGANQQAPEVRSPGCGSARPSGGQRAQEVRHQFLLAQNPVH